MYSNIMVTKNLIFDKSSNNYRTMSSTNNSKNDTMVVSEVVDISSNIQRMDIPSEVNPSADNGLPRGVERQALSLARCFMEAQGQLARKCYRRGELSHLYVSTFSSWAPEDAKNDKSLQRPFKQILFALAHGMKLVRVVNSGRQLLWNRYRDNTGKTIERKEESQDGRPREYRDDRRPPRDSRDSRESRPPRHYNNDSRSNRRDNRGGRRGGGRRDDGDWEVSNRRGRNSRDNRQSPRSPSTDRYEPAEMEYGR